MKDLRLTDVNAAAVATLRAEMLSNSPANITVLDIKDGSGVAKDSIVIGGNQIIQKITYGWQAFLAMCVAANLKIFGSDSNGSNGSILLANQVPEGTQYPIVSATGSTKTFLVATNVTGSFTAGDVLKVYNSDNTLFGTFTHVSDSYSSPNTSIVVSETLTNIAVSSGKFIINLGQ